MKLGNYIEGKWVEGKGQGAELYDASTGDVVALASTEGIDFNSVLNYGRNKGSRALRKLTFHQRARMLKKLALYLTEKKNLFYEISYKTGATKVDSWIDIEGGIGNLFVYASKGRRELPDTPFLTEGAHEVISKEGTFVGQHICVPMQGVAIHINAFNFPCWGMLEKIAVNLLAGMACVVKPATATSYLTEAMVREIISSGIFPEGSIQLLCGSARGITDLVTSQDVVTFTGSASTGQMLRAGAKINEQSVRFNLEADSLNCSILGPDAEPGSEIFNLYIKELQKEMTVKAGQKCTSIRRAMVPEKYIEDVAKALSERLNKNTIGDPRAEGVRMGPLASRDQLEEVNSKIEELKSDGLNLVYGGTQDFNISGGDKNKGAFISPTVLMGRGNKGLCHSVEAFGPVTTLIPYKDTDDAISLSIKGGGSLVGSVVTEDKNFAKDMVIETACMHGRLFLLNTHSAKESTGHGSPLPHLVHGGPGRAGGGEEMGGMRGVHHYMQRTAIQGDPTVLSHICERYIPGAQQTEDPIHPFKKFFEDLEIGETLVTHKRTVTEADIVNFANISGDNFYAHMDETSLEGSLFEKRVAHGYFVISAAAGLFVDPKKGPVLANYGLDELRFMKPVYVGATIGVRLTVKEKTAQEMRDDDIAPKGIVKWQVDVYDEEGETVALATILTLVQRKTEELPNP